MVELLAPAGSYDSFLAALNAGADAIYLGGEKYSARAYADNFTEEQILIAISLAHIYGVKIYMTVNTLVKESEIDELIPFLRPFYEAGLDGVIVQDFGVAYLVHQHFPNMELHASTQMTITSYDGAKLCKEYGFSRIVPARELSIQEIIDIKKHVAIEIESFVHGAMCYGYSGQCLFSSILGGRSGNRGRCAGPCRLPYNTILDKASSTKKEEYPISMKDMCSLAIIPDLIEAGVDSFKIEGRMKSPAYVAGVTSLYRKYIDLYYQKGRKGFAVEEQDMELLRKLYIRSEIAEGYYHKHNGRDMITLDKPSYLGSDDVLVKQLLADYVRTPSKHSVSIQCFFYAEEPACLMITDDQTGLTVTQYGELVQQSKNRPVSQEQLENAILQLGNTTLEASNISIQMGHAIFMPMGQVKELRRMAVAQMEMAYEIENGFERRTYKQDSDLPTDHVQNASNHATYMALQTPGLTVSCMTQEQLEVALTLQVENIYVDGDLVFDQLEHIKDIITRYNSLEGCKISCYLMLPYIKRLRDEQYFSKLCDIIREEKLFRGVVIRNIDELGRAIEWKKSFPLYLIADVSLYVMNRYAYRFLQEYVDQITIPFELNYQEMKQLTSHIYEYGAYQNGLLVYGSIPMLISANCIKKTQNHCDHQSTLGLQQYLEDRKQIHFPVYNNCRHCYNVLYNSLPISLHHKIKQLRTFDENCTCFRMDFVYESKEECQQIIDFYRQTLLAKKEVIWPTKKEYTTGHFQRGVE